MAKDKFVCLGSADFILEVHFLKVPALKIACSRKVNVNSILIGHVPVELRQDFPGRESLYLCLHIFGICCRGKAVNKVGDRETQQTNE